MNRKNMPLLLMLSAGVVTCIITFLEHYTVFEKLVSLLVVLVIFLMLGNVLKWTLDYFDRQNEEKLTAEGEVIEKELEEELESEGAEGESA